MRSVLVLLLCATVLSSAELPVTQVTLYKHGIGFFEREGTVPAAEDVRLKFETNDMNDLLKSLIVTDSSGNRITGIRYDANESLDQRLSKYSFHLGEQQPLAAFLDSLKGSRVQLTTATRSLSGAILGAHVYSAANQPEEQQLSVMLASGELTNVDIASLTSIRLTDSHQQAELQAYLATLANGNSRQGRSVFVESDAGKVRKLHLSYIAPTAVWKSSYRLSLAEKNSDLEGWAIVDNTSAEDWNNVRLAVVSGRPISFISPLDTARYGNREVAELPDDQAAGPVVYSGSLDAAQPKVGVGTGSGMPAGVDERLYRPGAGLTLHESKAGAIGGVVGPSPSASAPRQFIADQLRHPQRSSIEGATGSTLGELFEYKFDAPVTVKKNESAMLPFFQGKVQARKLLIYTEDDGEHPVNAAELTNTTGKTLDGGPATIYDGGAYAGEALFETLKPADKRLIGYAVDFGTRITTAFGSADQRVREIHAKDGNLHIRYAQRQTRTYSIKNVDARDKTLIIQQNVQDFTVITPKPLERTATAYRFRVSVPANASQTFKLEQERADWSAIAVSGASSRDLLVWVENTELSSTARAELRKVADLKNQLETTESSLTSLQDELRDLTNDQIRVRANLDSLNRVSGEESQVRAYAAQLAATDEKINNTRTQTATALARKTALENQIRDAISALSF